VNEVIYHAELCGGGPCDGIVLGVTLQDVRDQSVYFADGCTRATQIGKDQIWSALEVVGRIAVYRLEPHPTAERRLRFDFDGHLRAQAKEAR